MSNNKNAGANAKQPLRVHLAILAAIVALVVTGVVLASASFNFTDFVIKLHGG